MLLLWKTLAVALVAPLSHFYLPFQRAAVGMFVAASAVMLSPPPEIVSENTWNLGNGQVRLTDPVILQLADQQQLTLRHPRLLGSGGGGAVFAFEDNSNKVVLKVSWAGSAASVENECSVLQVLERNQVQGVEHCLALQQYEYDLQRRVMIALEPLVEDAVASPLEVDASLRPHAVQCLIRTMVQMLAARVVTVDVQPLISKQTGYAILIDLTEAKRLTPQSLSPLDTALVSSFVSEIVALIPESLLPTATSAMTEELQSLEKRGLYLSEEIYNMLDSQLGVVSEDATKP